MFPDHEFVSTSDSRCGESLLQIYLTDYRRYTVNSTGVERVAEPVWVGVRWALLSLSFVRPETKPVTADPVDWLWWSPPAPGVTFL